MNWTTARLALIGALLAVSSVASATVIVDFKPLPTSQALPEFVFSRALGGGIPAFRGGPGATGNADGLLPVAAQTPGGLDSEAPFPIGAFAGVPAASATGTGTQ